MKSFRLRPPGKGRHGITMVESLTAVTITTIAGAALLTSIGSAVHSSTEMSHSAVAGGLAEQLMAEVEGSRVPARDEAVSALAPFAPEPIVTVDYGHSAYYLERSGTRESFRTIDDFHGWSSTPPVDRAGRLIGTEGYDYGNWDISRLYWMRPDSGFLHRCTREVEIERVLDDGTSWKAVTYPTNARRCTVRVKYTDARSNTKTLAELTRIFTYVPTSP